jgi:hypothetical protein
MKNFSFLFAAWMVGWAVFFVYELSIWNRLGRLKGEIERLKRQLQ